MEKFLDILVDSSIATFYQLICTAGPIFLAGLLLHFASSSLERSAIRLLGLKGYLYSFGWLSTFVHELGHAIFCPLFGHKIEKMRLFTLNTRNQASGYVEHTYNRNNPFQIAGNLFISLGPLILGTMLIYLVLRFLYGVTVFLDVSQSSSEGFRLVFHEAGRVISAVGKLLVSLVKGANFKSVTFYLALYFLLAISGSMSLSVQDIKAGSLGLTVLTLLMLVLNVIMTSIGNPLSSLLIDSSIIAGIVFLLIVSLLFCLIAALIFGFLNKIFRR